MSTDSKAAELSEREAFEAYEIAYWRSRGFGAFLTDGEFVKRKPDGRYLSIGREDAWRAWQARGVADRAQPVQEPSASEPIYQYRLASGAWVDQTKESYDYNVEHTGTIFVRALYTAPQPAAPAVPGEIDPAWNPEQMARNGREAWRGQTAPDRVGMTAEDVRLLETALEQFDDDGETTVPHEDLVRFASMGLLECTHFIELPAARAAINAANGIQAAPKEGD